MPFLSDFISGASGSGNNNATDPQAAGIADQTITATGNYSAFYAATDIPSISPITPQVDDYSVTYPGMPNGGTLTAVVRKPVSAGMTTYQVPALSGDARTFLQDEIENAFIAGHRHIRLEAGQTYNLVPTTPTARHLAIQQLVDVDLDLNGATLECTQVSLGVLVEECERLVIRNGTLKGYGFLASIATVEEDAGNAAEIKFVPLTAYANEYSTFFPSGPPIRTVGSAEAIPGDSLGRYRVKIENHHEIFTNRGNATDNFVWDAGDGSWRGNGDPLSKTYPWSFGDYVWIQHENNTGHGILLDAEDGDLSDITIKDMVLQNIPGMGIVGEVKNGVHIDNVTYQLDPTDPLGFIATASDAFHLNSSGGDSIVENSQFGPNHDDKITSKANWWQVKSISGTLLAVEQIDRDQSVNRWGYNGDNVLFIDGSFGVVGTATLTADTYETSDHFLTLDAVPPGVVVGSIIGNVSRQNARHIVRNNTLDRSRAQGVLLQCQHAVIENNHFEGISGPPIEIAQQLNLWYESIRAGNVLIDSNTFTRNADSYQETKSHELIHIQQSDQAGNPVSIIDDVVFVGNSIPGSSSQGIPGRTFYEVTNSNSITITVLDAFVIAEGGATVNLPSVSGAAAIQISNPHFGKTGTWGSSNFVTVNANVGRLIGTNQYSETGDAVLSLDSDIGSVWLTTSNTSTTDWVVGF